MVQVIRRRAVLQAAAGVTALAASGGTSHAQSGFDWKRAKGQHIEVSMAKSPRGDLYQAHLKEFTELTGITVGFEQIPEQQQRQKLVIEFTSGHPSFDVVTIGLHVQKRLIGRAKWCEDLRAYIADPNKTAPEFDIADFSKTAVDYATQPDGRMDSLPTNIDYWTLFWNKELFEKKGLKAPQTYAEVLDAAKALNDPKAGISGMAVRGLKNANTLVWTNFLIGWDINAIDPDLAMHTDSAQAVDAAKLYQSLCRDAGPPGIAGFNWYECQASFVLGRSAMWFDSSGFALPLEDPAKSRVVGKVGYGVMPAGPKTRASGMTADALGIPAASKNKDAAWLFLQWAAGKDMMAAQLSGSFGAPPRKSSFDRVLASPDTKANKEWLQSMVENAKIARPGLPEIMSVTEFRDVFGVALTNMIGGADAEAELKKATQTFKPTLEKTENG